MKTYISIDDLIELALCKEAALEQEAYVLSVTRPYDWVTYQVRAKHRASDYRHFVRVAEELKRLL